MRRRAPGLIAPPGRRLLLRDADHDHPKATLALGRAQVRARDQLLGLALFEMHHRDLLLGREALDRAHIPSTDLAQRRWRGDRHPTVEQEPYEHPLGLQLGYVPGKKDPICRIDLERDPLAQ